MCAFKRLIDVMLSKRYTLQLPATFHPRREVHYVAVHGASQELDPLATSGHSPEHIKVNLTVSNAAINSCKLYHSKRILLRPLENCSYFLYPTLPVSFGGDTKSRRSLLSGVYARGSKRSHTGGKCVTCDSTF